MPDISIDWLSFSYDKKNEYDFDFYAYFKNLIEGLKGELVYHDYCSLIGYHCYWRCDEVGVNIYWDKCNNWHIDLSGQGCQFVNKYSDFQSLLVNIVKSNSRVTRLDLAGDDFENLIDFDDIENCWRYGLWRGAARSIDCRMPRGFDGRRLSGCTFYIGSPSSDCYMRIYDKQVQMETDKPWVRCELQLRRGYAHKIVALYALQDFEQISEIYRRICYDRVRFLKKKDENRNSEYDIPCEWWLAFLDGCNVGFKLTRNDEIDYLKTLHWLETKCISALSLYREVYTFSGIIRLTDEGKQKMSKRHQIMLAELKAEEQYIDYAERIERLSDREYRDIEEIFNGSEESGKFSCYS